MHIQDIAAEAVEEASSLIALLGILPDTLTSGSIKNPLSPITSWILDNEEFEDESECNLLVSDDNNGISAIVHAISQYRTANNHQHLDSLQIEELDRLTNAAIAISVEEQISL